MNEAKKNKTNSPVKTVRCGAVAASIWKRQSPSGYEYYDFSLSRSWKATTSGREGYSPNFFPRNEVEISTVIREASSWILNQLESLPVSDNDLAAI